MIRVLVSVFRRLDTESTTEPPLRQIIDVLQQVMCRHDAEKLGISVLEVYEDGYREERSSSDGIHNAEISVSLFKLNNNFPYSLQLKRQ